MTSDDLGLAQPPAQAAEGDELERLRDALGVATQALEKIAEPTNGKEPGIVYLEQRRELATITLIALSQASHVGLLAPSQLSMPSAMLGDIPSDVLDRAKDALRACRHEWDDDTKDHSTAAFFMASRAIMLDRAALSAEAAGTIAAAQKQAAEEMRERAANTAELIGQSYESAWRQDRKADPYLQGCADTADEVATAIRALPPSSSPEDQQKAAATPTIADPDGEVRS